MSNWDCCPLSTEALMLSKPGWESDINPCPPTRIQRISMLMHFEGATVNGKPSLPIHLPFYKWNKKADVRNNSRPSDGHAPQIRSARSARCVQRFNDSLLQFTLLIAIRCVLHRWENQEIRCQKLFFPIRRPHYQSFQPKNDIQNPKNHKCF